MAAVSQTGIKLVKKWEGCVLKAEPDCVGVPTIGYGITSSDRAVTGTEIRNGMEITQAKADEWLVKALNLLYLPKVMEYDRKYGWNQNEIDALVSFAYNLGTGCIDTLTADGTRTRAEIASKWTAYCKAGGKTLKGLLDRRKDERALFLKKVTKSKYKGAIPSVYPPRGYYKDGDGYGGVNRHRVRLIQRFLIWWGADIEDDGHYGPATEAAVKAFQKSRKLETNGCWGKKCREKAVTCRK